MSVAKVNVDDFNKSIKDIDSKIYSDFLKLSEKIETEISSIKNLIIERLQDENKILRQRVKMLENKVQINLQYQRRENIIIDGLPALSEASREEIVINLLNKIDVKVSASDLVACHPLSRKDNPPLILF